MAKNKDARALVTLKCSVCGERNYRIEKNKANTKDRLELNKHCKRCQKHTLHKEAKDNK